MLALQDNINKLESKYGSKTMMIKGGVPTVHPSQYGTENYTIAPKNEVDMAINFNTLTARPAMMGGCVATPLFNEIQKYLRTRVRNLKKPLESSGIKYDQIFKSIQNLSLSKITLDEYLNTTFKELIRKDKKEIIINFSKYLNLSRDTKMALINKSIKQLKNNYYDLRSKKVDNLIENLEKRKFKKSTLGGCIFFKKGKNLCLKVEKK